MEFGRAQADEEDEEESQDDKKNKGTKAKYTAEDALSYGNVCVYVCDTFFPRVKYTCLFVVYIIYTLMFECIY